MQSRSAQAAIALVLLTCLVCPVFEMFDYWDHTLQTGGDTEYGLVVLALCVGVVFCLKHLAVALSQSLSGTGLGFSLPSSGNPLISWTYPLQLCPSSESPPLNRRI